MSFSLLTSEAAKNGLACRRVHPASGDRYYAISWWMRPRDRPVDGGLANEHQSGTVTPEPSAVCPGPRLVPWERRGRRHHGGRLLEAAVTLAERSHLGLRRPLLRRGHSPRSGACRPDTETADTVRLIVPELATNAVQHTFGQSPTFTVGQPPLHPRRTPAHRRHGQPSPLPEENCPPPSGEDNGARHGHHPLAHRRSAAADSASRPRREGGKTVSIGRTAHRSLQPPRYPRAGSPWGRCPKACAASAPGNRAAAPGRRPQPRTRLLGAGTPPRSYGAAVRPQGPVPRPASSRSVATISRRHPPLARR